MAGKHLRAASRGYVIARAVSVIVAVFVFSSLGVVGVDAQTPAPAPAPAPEEQSPVLAGPTPGPEVLAEEPGLVAELAQRNEISEAQVVEILEDESSVVSPNGGIFYADPAPAGPVPEETPLPGPFPHADTFELHSKPGSDRTIYIDFDGHTIVDTLWSGDNNGPLTAAPYDSNGNPAFHNTELDAVQAIWQRVAEDFAPFDVDVTTEDPGTAKIERTDAADTQYGTRVVVTNTSAYEVESEPVSVGGFAFLGAFNELEPFNPHWMYQPAWVFPATYNHNSKYVAEVVSHEVGHTLGLDHDGQSPGLEYYEGHGVWAPIMGDAWSKPVGQWSKGEYTAATNTEDDLAVAATYGAPWRADDHSDTGPGATPLDASVSGVITPAAAGTDVDVFEYTATAAGNVRFTANPAPSGPNLDVALALYSDTMTQLAQADPPVSMIDYQAAAGLSAAITYPVSAGTTYYLQVAPTGYLTPSTGYSSYGSLGQYTLTAAPAGAAGITVTLDAQPTEIPESGPVAYTVTVANNSAVRSVTIGSLASTDGPLDGDDDCMVGTELGPLGMCTFGYSANVSGNAGETKTATVTVTGTDDNGDPVTGGDDASVPITDAMSRITVTVDTYLGSILEPGGPVDYSVKVKNASAVDAVTIDSLASADGPLDGDDDCKVGAVISAGNSCLFILSGSVSGNAGQTKTITVTATGTDDDGQTVTDSDDQSVSITGTESEDHVTVWAYVEPASVAAPGGTVTVSVVVANTDYGPITINSIFDPAIGMIGDADCTWGTVLDTFDVCAFSYSTNVSGTAGETKTITVGVNASDQFYTEFYQDLDDVSVSITGAASSLAVTADADPDSVVEPGGPVDVTVTVTNTSPADAVTIVSLADGAGTLAGDGDCKATTVLAAGASCTFSYSTTVSGNAGQTKTITVTATGTDDDGATVTGSGDASVSITGAAASLAVTADADPDSVVEPGGAVDVAVTVTNTSAADAVTIASLADGAGTLAGDGDCMVGTVLAVGGSCSFSYSTTVSGNAGQTKTITVTASGTDDDGATVTDSGDASVSITGAASSLAVTADADPDSVTEPGGPVDVAVTVTNTSAADAVTIASLADGAGTLAGDGDCKVGTVLAVGGSCSFSYSTTVSGNGGETKTVTVTATGTDDDGATVTDSGDASVSITGAASSLAVTADADPDSVVEPGGPVDVAVTVANTSAADAVTIASLADGAGTLDGDGDCKVGTVLAVGGSCSFSYSTTVSGNGGETKTVTVTATGTDDDGATVTDSGDASVSITGAASSLAVTADADPDSVVEPGGPVDVAVTVANTSAADAVTIASLADGAGTLDGDGDCKVGTVLAVGGSCSFSYSTTVSGNGGETKTVTVTATGTDDDGATVTDSGDASVSITGAASSLAVTVDADPDSVVEPGGPVDVAVTVANTSPADAVTIVSLADGAGTLAGDADCMATTVLAAGASCTFSYSTTVSGNAGETKTVTVTATGTDDDGATVTDSGDASVSITGAASSLAVTADADPDSVVEPGGPVDVTVTVTNTSPADAVTIASLADTTGTLAGDGDCKATTVLAAGASCTFSYSTTVSGNAGQTKTITVTASGTDDDGATVTDSGDVSVSITGVASSGSLVISKVFDPLTSGVSRTFPINWTCNNGTSGAVQLAGGTSATVGAMPAGTVCSVTEARPGGAPTGWYYANPTVTGSPATITAGAATAVTVTNKIVRRTSSLRVTKVVKGAPSAFAANFGVVVACSGDGGSYSRTILYPLLRSATISGIPTNTQCSVSEPGLPPAPAGYQWAAPKYSAASVTIVAGRTAAVTVTNTLVCVDTVAPAATFTRPGLNNPLLRGRPIKLNGGATDNVGVVSVSAAIRNTATGRYLQPNGTWATNYAALSTVLSAPGAKSTGWSISRALPDGSYSIELVPTDAAGNTTTPRPTRNFRVDAP